MWESGLFTKAAYDDMISVTSSEGIDGMMSLIRRMGVLCGPSSGAIFQGLQSYFKSAAPLTEPKTAVFIVCDRVESYLSYIRARRPELFNEKPRMNSFRAFQQKSFPVAADLVLSLEAANDFVAKRKPLIIDTRSNIGFKTVAIPGSINIPSEAFEVMIDSNRPFSPDQPVLLVCPVGDKSIGYASYLRLQGCEVYSLEMGPDGLAELQPAVADGRGGLKPPQVDI